MTANEVDEYWMQKALALAEAAGRAGEVPVGAVLVRDGELLGEGSNAPITTADPTAHAEIRALRAAATAVGNYRLTGTTLYVTIEPCAMCAGAMVHARVKRLVFGAREPRAGSVVSRAQLLDADYTNHRVEVTEGVLAERCSQLITEFFCERRAANSND